MASAAERLYGKAPAAPVNRFAAQAPTLNIESLLNRNHVKDVWAPPTLQDGKFTSQQDIDDFKAAIGNTGYVLNPAGSLSPPPPDTQAVANNTAAAKWGIENGFYTPPPKEGHGGIRGVLDFGVGAFKNIVLTPPVLAALTAGAGAALGAGAGTAAGAGAEAGAEGIAAGQAAGLSVDQLLAQSAAGLSIATPAETAAALGAGTEIAAAGAAGAGTQFGGTAQSAAGDAGTTGGGSKGAAYLSTAKDVAGLALTGLGLAAATGMVSPGAAQAPPEPTAPPQDQVSSVDQQGVAQADESGQRFPNLGGSGDDTLFNGASGIDPFMLNLGRAKLLGQ